MKPASWPRYMVEKRLASGVVSYYWSPQRRDLAKGCPVHAEALGPDYGAAVSRAATLNEHLDSWRAGRGASKGLDIGPRFGTVDWWIERYTRMEAFTTLTPRSRDDYREALERLANIQTELRDASTGARVRVGALPVSSLSPAAVDKLYAMLRAGGAIRQANYPIDVARRAWKVVARQYPAQFLIPNPSAPRERIALNPFVGVERIYGDGTTEPASREEARALAEALDRLGHPSLGAAALICFEWLQRPENVIAGHLAWTDYCPPHRPRHVRIDHHKTGKKIWQPLEDSAGRLYPELEDFLERVPRLGVPVVLLEPQRAPRTPRPYSLEHARHLVQGARKLVGLPDHVTLAACRHGGMTELGDAGLTEAQVMALSAHETPDAARLYVKRTEVQRTTAARARRIWLDAQAQQEQIPSKSRNDRGTGSRNGPGDEEISA
jgi:hypothetical protein